MTLFNCCLKHHAYDHQFEIEKGVNPSKHFESKASSEWRKARSLAVTAIALAILTLLAIGSAYVLFGIGTMPETMTIGFGIVPSLLGTFLTYFAIGLGTSALGFGSFSAYHCIRAHALDVRTEKAKNSSSFLDSP